MMETEFGTIAHRGEIRFIFACRESTERRPVALRVWSDRPADVALAVVMVGARYLVSQGSPLPLYPRLYAEEARTVRAAIPSYPREPVSEGQSFRIPLDYDRPFLVGQSLLVAFRGVTQNAVRVAVNVELNTSAEVAARYIRLAELGRRWQAQEGLAAADLDELAALAVRVGDDRP